MKVVNIASTEMMKEVVREMCTRHSGAMRSIEPGCEFPDVQLRI